MNETPIARLKRLEMQGFKSFAGRVVFEFGPGITAIVGPNGSGKSNIADAFRWVLGEQNPRLLRLRRIEDLIFAGGSKRGPLGFAEVTLVLDNSDNWLPLEYAEVALTRRLHRSGESEYLVNRHRVRLRDILDLLLKGRVGQNSYAILGQGMVDMVLSLKPDERRNLIEEAADVRRHRLRIDEATDQLAATRDNLDRVELLLAEITPRLAQLERQARRAAEHAQLSREFSSAICILYTGRWHRAVAEEVAAGARWEDAQGQLDAAIAKSQELDQQLGATAGRARSARRALEEREIEHRELLAQIRLVERQLMDQRAAVERLNRRRAEIETELLALENEAASLGGEWQGAESTNDRDTAKPMSADEAVREAAEHVAGCQESLARIEPALAKAREMLGAAEAEQRRLQSLVDESQRRLLRGGQEQQSLDQSEARLRERRRAALERISLWAGEFRASHELARRLARGVETAERATLAAERQEQAAATAVSRCQQRALENERGLDRAHHRLDLLQGERDSHRPSEEILVALLDALRGSGPGRPRVLGVVGGLIQVQEGLEIAIQAALADSLDAAVVRTQSEALSAVRTLREIQHGRLNFFALDGVHGARPLNLNHESGIVGVASSLVRCDESARELIDSLLGKVVVVENLEAAQRILSRGLATAVTLDGTVMRPGGGVSGGSGKADGAVFRGGREIEELQGEVERLEAVRHALETELSQERERSRVAEDEAHRRRDDLEGVTRRLRAAQAESEKLRRRLDPLRAELVWLRSATAELVGRRAELRAADAAAQQELERYQMSEQQNQPGVHASVAELGQIMAHHEMLRSELAAAQGVLAARERERATITAMHQSRRAMRERSERLSQARRETLGSLAGEHLEANLAAASSEAELDGLLAAADRLPGELQELRRQVEQLSGIEQSCGSDLDQARHHAADRERAALDAELQVKRATEELQRLREEISVEGLDSILTEAAETRASADSADLPALDARVRSLRARVRNLGAVNAEAEADYTETKDRHDFLSTQLSDLRQAETNLLEAIVDLRSLVRERFRESFQRINGDFQRYFRTFFGGGSARLLLTEPEDYGESGVDVMAQPPGKRLQNLAMLSGGERSMTAVALLFALLESNPAPFCVLDEVDAALDESNVGRFGEALATLAGNSQFLVITHNRGTLQLADHIYGISMMAEGVSSVLSLRLAEAAPLLA